MLLAECRAREVGHVNPAIMMTDDEHDRIEVLSSQIVPNGTVESTQQEVEECAGDAESERERKRVARAVAVVSGLLFILSIVLVGVSFTMSANIDNMGKWIYFH